MRERIFCQKNAPRGIGENVLGSGLARFVNCLVDSDHQPKTIGIYVRAAARFGGWIESQGLDRSAINEDAVLCFLYNGQHSNGGSYSDLLSALRHFLEVLREYRLIPKASVSGPTTISKELEKFEEHLRATCGLADSTIHYRIGYVRHFLISKYHLSPVKFKDLQASDSIDLVSDWARTHKPGSCKALSSSLRSYLQFLSLRQLCRAEIVNAVARIPNWKKASIPRTLSDEQLKTFFSGFDHATATGCRDYAMCRCLSELGLRASEVAALSLDGIDWRRGTLTVSSSKTRRSRLLPLPRKLGRPIVQYLRNGRPNSVDSHVFLRHKSPKGTAIGSSTVRSAVFRASRRAGLKPPFGPHIFRHTIASRINRNGATFKQIADLLGHRQIDTVSIYTKVDLEQLSDVSLPWPEVQS